ncbi:anthranilate phosphoribosyltransferase [Kribbella albertanoniae]|uniref:Anthranilate phosphoribosyltransferase n=1 Tax=Kribbella albertanoniae TaxID=1266829 RepID=A0A4R4Q8L4_9ACTN|nr:anthranilate phosphoribosyltransferase [Kribbella albertanoniae]TDC31540.1 anthranilate phosphoribosyltransferase [Kribbella albertanoniae]
MATALRTWSGLISSLLNGSDLTTADTGWAMDQVVLGDVSPAQISGFLIALRAKGETADELLGLASVLRSHAIPVRIDGPFVDIVGTGGDRTGAINVSTMAAVVAASTGVTVVKHGGRAASSAAGGSADLVEQLGVPLDLSASEAARSAAEVGLAYLFAPRFNPALRQAAVVRRELGVPTAFNVLAPLLHPADPQHQLVGVANPQMLPVIAQALCQQGKTALVARGDDGLDKLTTTTFSRLWLVSEGTARETVFDPRGLGLRPTTLPALRGGDAASNARVLQALVNGEPGPVRDVVLLNAAAALTTLNLQTDHFLDQLAACLDECRAALDSGRTAATLARWIGSK